MLTFEPPLRAGRLIRRYQRFFADVLFEDRIVTAHCANTGRMTGLLETDAPVWIRPQLPGRKLKFAWELVEIEQKYVCVNTARANQLFAETPTDQWMPGTTWVRREPRWETHRFDALLKRGERDVFVEIKSVTLCEGSIGYFPDAPSTRALSHLALLADMAAAGIETHLIFAAMHAGIESIEPARHVTPEFAAACVQAENAGVHFHGFRVSIDPESLTLGAACPVRL